jgi:hypothetical protein
LAAVPMHLMAFPATDRKAAVVAVKMPLDCCPVEGKKACCPETALAALPATEKMACCPGDKPHACCPDGKCCDEVVVRTYSVSEFLTDRKASPDELIKLITTMVAPDTWMTRDSNIDYFPQGKCLVVRHRAAVQTQVNDLVMQLRTAMQSQGETKVSFSVTCCPAPIVQFEKTACVPVQFEVVAAPPLESPLRLPRVFTDDAAPCFDDEFFGLAPMRRDGRLLPVPMLSPRITDSSLLPASFTPMADPQPGCFEDGPINKVQERKVPDFFPMYLPFAPLPLGPEACEEDGVREKKKN